MVERPAAPDVRFSTPAVLALLFEEAGEARLVFTRRVRRRCASHRGRSASRGAARPGRGRSAAALREAHEEVGLDPATVTTAGWIHPVLTMVTGSLIMPIVGTVPARPHLVANPAEVERVFDVALRDLADRAIFHEERWSIPGREIPGSPDNSFAVWFFEVDGETIWGATARMIHELLSVVLLPAVAEGEPERSRRARRRRRRAPRRHGQRGERWEPAMIRSPGPTRRRGPPETW